MGLEIDNLPKVVIHTLSEDLLKRFADLPLLSRYDVYQRLMDYWAETMQDDVYLIAADGWVEAARPRGIIEDKDKKLKETPDLVIKRRKYKMDLVPPSLMVARYFASERAEIEALQAVQETAAGELEEFVEEHTGEEGFLEDATNDKGKVTKGSVKDRLKALEEEPESDDERDVLERCLDLVEAELAANRAVKAAQAALDAKVLARYAKLTEAEIKTLVVEDKWFASIRGAIEGEVDRLTQKLAGRVKELEERYARPLPGLQREVEAFSTSVEEHLRKMGLAWAIM
jgi:type I restriction enzyme M protein